MKVIVVCSWLIVPGQAFSNKKNLKWDFKVLRFGAQVICECMRNAAEFHAKKVQMKGVNINFQPGAVSVR